MRIPNAERAVVDIRKLRDYCLNPQHNRGKHKAHLFTRLLDMRANDAEELRNTLLEAVKTQDAQLGETDAYGQRYTLDFTLNWRGKQARIRSAWIIETGSDIPKLTTAFPLTNQDRL